MLPLPNLYLIGGMRCGTTSLHRQLGLHPEIYMSAVKEPELFLDRCFEPALRRPAPAVLREALRGYAGEPVVGEASTSYSKHPVFGEDVARRIHEAAPGARILYLLRDPVERILSEHGWWCRRERREIPFAEFMDAREEHFLPISGYHRQLARYLDHFPREQVRVVLFEELCADPERELRAVFEFLDVAAGVELAEPFRAWNARPAGQTAAEREARLAALRDRYAPRLAPEVRALEDLLERSLDGWTTWAA